jgi:hypothetical protein
MAFKKSSGQFEMLEWASAARRFVYHCHTRFRIVFIRRLIGLSDI